MHSQLHNLIGQQITHNNKLCILIEVIDSETITKKTINPKEIDNAPSLVFQCQTEKHIQHDQHGSAHRRSMPTFTIHCLNEFKTDLHPVLKTLLNEDEQHSLLQQLL